jgi:hemolysin D
MASLSWMPTARFRLKMPSSVVRTVAVKMGQKVKASEVLVTLDPTFSRADEAELSAKLRHLNAAYDRIETKLAGGAYNPPDPKDDERTQQDIFRKRRDEFAARIAASDGKIEESKADLAAHKTEVAGLEEQIRLSMQAEDISADRHQRTPGRGPVASCHQPRRATETGRRDRLRAS